MSDRSNAGRPLPPGVSERLRVFVLTDIENEPDDAQSLVRFLTYCNQWDVEGIVATTSRWLRDRVADWRIREIVDAYGQVVSSLLEHEPGYPSRAELDSVVGKGIDKYGLLGVGSGCDSDGSQRLLHRIMADDPRPLWILAWGGTNVLAQALWQLRRKVGPTQRTGIVSRLRVYAISDQDDTGCWIRKTFPGLFYIVSPGFEEQSYHYATWNGISGDRFHGRFDGPDFSLVDNPWLDKHIRQNHGPLGSQHPQTKFLMEGDTPTFLYLVANGLGSPERPNFGSWGGRYELYTPPTRHWFSEPETRPIWTDTLDEVCTPRGTYTSNQATIWRWREAYQYDFAARIDWTVSAKGEANHPPVASLDHDAHLSVASGETVRLSATSSTDPDGDDLRFQWIVYREVGSYGGLVTIERADRPQVEFLAPDVQKGEDIHVILAATDTGTPPLTRYRRVIVDVLPG
jgi:hypothetical protein